MSLDICGVLPTSEETEQFVADADPAKREKLVDKLLERKEFVELWVMKWSELLQIRSTQYVSYKATLLYYTWLQEQIAGNVPINEMVQKLLGAQGGTFSSPATNYFQAEQDRLKTAENVAQVFHGHAHPVRPVPQSSVRSLDDGRLLQLCGVLRADRPQGRRRPARDDRVQRRAAAK